VRQNAYVSRVGYSVRIASAVLIAALLAGSAVYAGLLTNWFRYTPSLEATFVLLPLVLGTLVASALALVAAIKLSRRQLIGAGVIAVAAAGAVVGAQLKAFGQLPALSTNHVVKSPIGTVTTTEGALQYWLQLENPFARSHGEYLILRGKTEETRVAVPIFDGPAGGFLEPLSAEDWGRLMLTSDANLLELELGPKLIGKGRFRIDLRKRHAERIL
jgi:hypothetical protein